MQKVSPGKLCEKQAKLANIFKIEDENPKCRQNPQERAFLQYRMTHKSKMFSLNFNITAYIFLKVLLYELQLFKAPFSWK